MKTEDTGMQTMQQEKPLRQEPAAAPVSTPLPLRTAYRRKPNAAAEAVDGTVAEAEIATRMRKKMLRKFLIRTGLCVLAFSAVFLHFFGDTLLALLRGNDDMFIRKFHEPVSLAPNPKLMELMYDSAMNGCKDFYIDTELLRCNTAEQANEIINATYTEMLAERPEVFFTGGVQGTFYLGEKNGQQLCKKTDISISVLDDFKNMPLKKMCADMQKTAKRIVSQAPKHCSDYEKALFVHDYLVQNVQYDVPGSKSGYYDLCFTAYGALEDGSAVCKGYSCAYAYLMRLMNIDCRVVSGEVKQSGMDKVLVMLSLKDNSHAWNYIDLDGEHYWVDVTWDDPVDENGNDCGGPVAHSYCFVDDDKIFETRKLGDGYDDLEPCRSMKLNDQLLQADQN